MSTDSFYTPPPGGAAGPVAAADVSYDNTTSGLASVEVQAALDEVVGIVQSPSFYPETLANQTPANGRYYTQYGVSLFNTPAASHIGGLVRIRFWDPCTITHIGLFLSSAHSGGAHDYRLGIYDNFQAEPQDLLVDAGTLTINNTNGSAGVKELALASPLAVDGGTTYWLACQTNLSGSLPALTQSIGHLQPYSDYGLTLTNGTATSAVAFRRAASGSTALPATFSLGTPQTLAVTPTVYVKVSV